MSLWDMMYYDYEPGVETIVTWILVLGYGMPDVEHA